MMVKQLPDVRNYIGYRKESALYAEKRIETLKVSEIEKAIAKAYLDGAQSAICIGYRLAEEDYKEVLRYYKNKSE